MTSVLLREDTNRKRNHTEPQLQIPFAQAEIEAMLPQSKVHLELSEAGRDKKKGTPLGTSEEVHPFHTLILNFWSPEM